MKKVMVFLMGVVFLSWMAPAQASLKEVKTYKEAFPEAKPKCIGCHMTAMPKKDDGQHELNDYGQAVMAEAQKEAAAKEAAQEEVKPTADTYKAVGKIEDFKKTE